MWTIEKVGGKNRGEKCSASEQTVLRARADEDVSLFALFSPSFARARALTQALCSFSLTCHSSKYDEDNHSDERQTKRRECKEKDSIELMGSKEEEEKSFVGRARRISGLELFLARKWIELGEWRKKAFVYLRQARKDRLSITWKKLVSVLGLTYVGVAVQRWHAWWR